MVNWKKEIKLSDLVGGSKEDSNADSTPHAEKQSIWKKEISFGRKSKDTAAQEPAAAPAPAPAPAPAAPAAAPLELVDPHVTLGAAPEPAAAPERTLGSVVELFGAEAVQPERAETQPLPAAVPPPAPVVVHPPVPADMLPPVADDELPKSPKAREERAPFYKREISLGRNKENKEKAAKLKAEKPPKPKAEKPAKSAREKTPKVERERRPRGGKTAKRVVGLKVGASQLAAATVANNGHPEVIQLARESLEPGIVSGGELREPEVLAEALREFFKKHKLPKRGVRLGIATNRIGVRTLEISGIEDGKQLANAVRFRAQEALPIPIDEAVLDYQMLEDSTNEAGERTRRILLVLAYRDLIDRYVSACKKAGITLSSIDLEAFALLRALAAPREEATHAGAALVAVTIGHDRTTFAVSDGRVCEFTRVLDWGGHALNVALARVLERAPSETEAVKRALSLDGTEVPEGLTAEQAQAARDALRKQVQSFARELVSSLQFYQNQPGSLGIGEIVLTGGTAHLAGLADELQRLIGVGVRVGDPLARVKLNKKFKDPEQLGSLAVAIGLGIDD